jgi:rubrerythrin
MPIREAHVNPSRRSTHPQTPAEPRDEHEMVRVDPDEIVALLAVARLDLEVAEAYQIATAELESGPLASMLTGFSDEHRRHADDLLAFARRHDTRAEIARPDPQRSVLLGLASAVGGLDPVAAVEAMIGNELLTSTTYDTGLWVVSDEEALAIVKRNRDDERRHLDALTRYMAEHGDGG